MSEYRLIVLAGPDCGRDLALPLSGDVLIGRAPDCRLQLTDPSVSRRQCRIVVDDASVRLEDLGSKWGVLVNGRKQERCRLEPGDRLLLGDTEIRLETVGPPSTQEAGEPRRARPQAPARPKAAAEPPLRDVTSLAGQTFLRYRLGGIEAKSGSGVLYRALDLRDNRRVALKLYHPDFFADEPQKQRFLRAMRTMLPVEHPHLVRLFGAGRSRSVCFTASEFIEGESARQMIHRIGVAGTLDWKNVWRIAVQILRALVFTEERNIVHRNIQPGNLLVRAEDRCAKLGDLMLARALHEKGDSLITRKGEIVGDLSFAAPEQITGERRLDNRVDVYGLGATLYALLTGRPPFTGTPAELVEQIRSRHEVPISHYHLAVPSGFEGILHRMLSKRPEDRCTNVVTLLRDVENVGKYQGLAAVE